MNLIFTCGGTAGHINPAIAVANMMKERHPGCHILFIGASGLNSRKIFLHAFTASSTHLTAWTFCFTAARFLPRLRPEPGRHFSAKPAWGTSFSSMWPVAPMKRILQSG